MGRYETLKKESQIIIDCLLPQIAANFGVKNVTDVIPADICMRAWDCERRDHIYSQPEEDPRHWGLQFLKDLGTISSMKKATLEEFQRDLREKVEAHKEEHPWARMADIKEVLLDYLHPERKNPPPVQESEDAESENSYYELVETGQSRRGSGDAPMFEARPVEKKKKSKHAPKRLRRGSSEGWGRKDKPRRSATLSSNRDGSFRESSLQQEHAPSPSYNSKRDLKNGSAPNHDSNLKYDSFDDDAELDAMSVSELEVHVQLREAELRAARLKAKLAEVRRKRDRRPTQSRQSSMDTRGSNKFVNGRQRNIRRTTEGTMRAKSKPARHRNLVHDDDSDSEMPVAMPIRNPVHRSTTSFGKIVRDESDSEMPAALPTRKLVGRKITSFANFRDEDYKEHDAEEESDRRYYNGRITDAHKRHPKPKVSRPIADSGKTMTPAPRVSTPSPPREAPVPVANMAPPPQLTVMRKPAYLPAAYVPTAPIRQESDEDHGYSSANEHSSEKLPVVQTEKTENTDYAGEESPLFTREE